MGSDKSVSIGLGNGIQRFTRTLVEGDEGDLGDENSHTEGEWLVDLMIGSKLTYLSLQGHSSKTSVVAVEPLIVNGNSMNNDQKDANAFSKHFTEGNKVPRVPIADPRMRRLRKALERRLKASNRTFEKGKATGLDGVTQEIIDHLGPKAKGTLFNLFNRMRRCGKLPRAWHTATVPNTLKKGKSATLAEKLLPNLPHICDQNDHKAYGERSAVPINLEKAYDQVMLQEHGITGRTYGWLKEFFTERFIRTRVKGTLSRTRSLADKLPQGNAISCTLFLIFMNNIDVAVRTSYADDIILQQQDIDIDNATEANNKYLASRKRFYKSWNIHINMSKTAYTTLSLSNPVL
ncbi:RNA-directed DNA polymerase from mobile element jockey [Plakobranchus ocellatus]|uniref:RNA-directed DNA polymerase from mobile element jockey n=1 Tax=Plakobranchus ocellatus TaxID=259542 RepID=A0AAV4BE73_9GAST|nr:RNA-directed DNA polymerase from mobile element jockey [Plakobranchus ocellatus]